MTANDLNLPPPPSAPESPHPATRDLPSSQSLPASPATTTGKRSRSPLKSGPTRRYRPLSNSPMRKVVGPAHALSPLRSRAHLASGQLGHSQSTTVPSTGTTVILDSLVPSLLEEEDAEENEEEEEKERYFEGGLTNINVNLSFEIEFTKIQHIFYLKSFKPEDLELAMTFKMALTMEKSLNGNFLTVHLYKTTFLFRKSC